MDMNYTNTSSPYLENDMDEDHMESVMEMLISQKIISTTVICVCLFTAVIHVLLIMVLKRCRKMPTALKWLSLNFVACNTLNCVTIALMSVLFLTLDTMYRQTVFQFRVILVGGPYCVACGMTAGLALERYIKLTYPYKFNRILSNLKVVLYIVSVWVISFVVPFAIVFDHFVMTCKSTLWLCDFSGAINKTTLFFDSALIFFTLQILWTVFIIRKHVHLQVTKIWQTTQVLPLNTGTLSTEDNMPHATIHTAPNTSQTEQRSCDVPCDTTKSEEGICVISNDYGVANYYSKHATKDVSVTRRDTCPSQMENLPDKISNIPCESQHMYPGLDIHQRDDMNTNSQLKKSKQLFEKRNFRATQNTLKIIITYVFFHILITVTGILISSFPEWKTTTTRAFVQTFIFVCSLAGTYITLYLYIWNFKECKMLFLITFCSWNPRLFDKGQQLKFDVYNIVTTNDIRKRKAESS